jgi:glycosyltransferase involved in cell wall biosynthesis
MKIAVVIPAYNEAKRIAPVLNAIPETIGEHEVIVVAVDDGSKDDTFAVAQKTGKATVIRHRINLGKGAAAKTGCDAAYRLGADILVLMDADGQHRPEDLSRLIEPILSDEKADMVIGARPVGGPMPLMMRIGNFGFRLVIRSLFQIPVRDTQSGYRAFARSSYPLIRWGASNYAMETEMLILGAKNRLRFAEVGIETIYLDGYKGTTVLDGLRIMSTLLKWKLLWSQEFKSLEPFSG